jgi:hypothetical protein
MKIKEYRSQFIQELLSVMMQAKQKVLSDTRREASVKRIDLALDPELIFSEGIGALEFYLRAGSSRFLFNTCWEH